MKGKWILIAAYGLCLAGVADTWMLSVSYVLHLQLPCGASDGCLTVALSSAARLFGVPLPVFGLAFYLLLSAVTAWTLLRPGSGSKWRPAQALYPLAVFGAAVSTAYTLYAVFGLHAVCLWCMVSNGIACVLAVLCGLDLGDFPVVRARWALIPAVVTLIAMGLGTRSVYLGSERFPWNPEVLARTSRTELMPDDAIVRKGKDGGAAIVMFLDVACPACQASFAQVLEVARQRDVSLAVRYLPEPLHPGSFGLCVLSEEASQQGKGLEFLQLATERGVETQRGGAALLRSLDLGESDASLRVGQERVRRDAALARRLGLEFAPSIFVVRGDAPAAAATPDTILAVLGPAPVAEATANKRP